MKQVLILDSLQKLMKLYSSVHRKRHNTVDSVYTCRPQPSLFYLHNQITTKSTVCVNYDYTTGCNTAVIQFSSKKSAKFPGKSWHTTTEQIYDF